ncbi:type I 3-dehydroquinate dehydratase [Haladaptatus caseinilyticus]|uniref:type I 3-dehydroquinate dehydratase n=1 Tax=Haladaptatus caseinilyticus TaxID=2993314 RepID=UPI00224AFA81|nr:type I 3-dehydroquinate dehydratase [Haladaptatus caseinilyticus]
MEPDQFALAATTNDLQRETQVREVADVVEFRMDKAKNPLSQLAEYDGELPIIATNRAQWFGGKASDSGRLDHLFTASEFEAVEMVDIELETARGSSWVLEEFEKGDVEIIISFHEFEETPDLNVLKAIFEACGQYGDIAKVAAYANNHTDSLNMLRAVSSVSENGLRATGISMGTIGSHTRAIAPLYGAKIGYAPLKSDESEYAPGQIPIYKLRSMIDTLRSSSNSLYTNIESDVNSYARKKVVENSK